MFGANVLEEAILTLDPDGAVSGKDVERLVDRDIGLECEDSGTSGFRSWNADLGLTPSPVSVAIFLGAAVAGETITLESSDDLSTWDPRGTVVPAADGEPARLDVTGAPVTARYWRWSITDPAAPVRFTEVFLSPAGIELQYKPSIGGLREPQIPNVTLVESASGRAWGVRRGTRRWSTRYVMTYAPDVDRTTVLDFLTAIEDGAKPFWLLTVTGELRWVRLAGNVDFQAADRSLSHWDIPLAFTEELP
jgi:hypothetical protein